MSQAGDRADVRVGFFGKLPSRGDFVRAGLSRDVAACWDAWLQTVMLPAREMLGEQWHPAWQRARAWRFTLTPGMCGRRAVTGMWLPSTDSVGRTFPLLVASESGVASDDFLDGIERIAAAAIRTTISPGRLLAELGQVAPPPPAMPSSSGADARWWSRQGASTMEFRSAVMPSVAAYVRMLTA